MEAFSVLGQEVSITATDVDLYTVPASTSTVCSTLAICNRGADGTVRVAIRKAGAAISNVHYLMFDTPVPANSIVPITIGMTLATTDVVTVQGSTNDFSFNLFGSEVS